MDEQPTTFFHLPGDHEYDPIHRPTARLNHDIRVAAYVALADGAAVTIHGMGLYRVLRSSFHVGHPDELPGMHIFLEAVETLD
jgi:hypothetical protein